MDSNLVIDFFKFPLKCYIGLLFFSSFLKKKDHWKEILFANFVITSGILFILNWYGQQRSDSATFLAYGVVYLIFLINANLAFENSVCTILFCGGVILATQQIAFIVWILGYAILIYPLVAPVTRVVEIAMYLPELVICVLAFGIIYHFFLKKLNFQDEVMRKNKTVIFIVGVLLMGIFVLFESMQYFVTGWNVYVYAYLYILVGCILAEGFLFAVFHENSMKNDVKIMQQMMAQREAQFRVSQSNIETINRKCHDMKYILKTVQYDRENAQIGQLMKDIEVYDSFQNTGNHCLDVVLTEYGLLCEQNNIQFTVMANGSLLKQMEDVDVYALFGNILENAAEECLSIEDVEQRCIILKVAKYQNFVAIHAENTCIHEVPVEDGLPVTHKDDKENHGFGTKSIRSIAQKYGGGVSIKFAHHTYQINIYIPLQEA